MPSEGACSRLLARYVSLRGELKLPTKEVNTELDKIFVWLASNKLTLNIKKSKFSVIWHVLFQCHEKKKHIKQIQIRIYIKIYH